MAENPTKIDPVLHVLGPCGLFAVVQLNIYYLAFLSDAYQLFSYVFTGQDVPYQCALATNGSDILIPELHNDWSNTTVEYGKCVITVTTSVSGHVTVREHSCVYGMKYDLPQDTSIVSDFDLVCERSYLAGLTQTLLSLGSGLGSLVCSTLSDWFGRKRTLVISQLLMLVFSVVAGLAPTYVVFLVTKLCIGFFQQGVSLTAVIAGIELFPSTHRFLANGFWGTLYWATCIASLALFAYLLRFESWRVLQLALSGGGVVVIVMTFVLYEPVQWLVAKNKIAEAEKVLKKAAGWNGKDFKKVLDVFHGLKRQDDGTDDKGFDFNKNPRTDHAAQDDGKADSSKDVEENKTDRINAEGTAEESLGFKEMFTHRRLRTNILVSCFIWFVDSWVYNALYLMSSQLAGSLHLNFFLNATVEGASCVMMLLLIERLGRKKLVVVFHIIAGLALIISGACFNYQDSYTSLKIIGTIFSLCGKMGMSGSFNTIYLYTPEIFPTKIRNRALGTSMAVSTMGAMIAPFTDNLADYGFWITGVIFGLCSLMATLMLQLLLPESQGRDLPQTLKDLEAWYDEDRSVSGSRNGTPVADTEGRKHKLPVQDNGEE